MGLVHQGQVEYIPQEFGFQHIQVQCAGLGNRWPYSFHKWLLKVLRLSYQGYFLEWLCFQQNCHTVEWLPSNRWCAIIYLKSVVVLSKNEFAKVP